MLKLRVGLKQKVVSGIMLTLLLVGILTLFSTSGIVYAKDTSNNWSTTGIQTLAATGETIRIAMFGCLHVGETTQAELNIASESINALDPDYVFSVGLHRTR